MYQFLLDEFHAHLAKADRAHQLGNIAEFLDELKIAVNAVDDFIVLLDEFKPNKERRAIGALAS
jgi:hypothetical protein